MRSHAVLDEIPLGSCTSLVYTVGSRNYETIDGVWHEVRERRNPEWLKLQGYGFLSYMGGIVLLRWPNTTTERSWQRGIAKLMTRLQVDKQQGYSVDSTERSVWERNRQNWRRFRLRDTNFVELK